MPSRKFGICMWKITYSIILFLICVYNVSAQTKLTKEEYAVYASVLKVLYNENRETYANKSEFVFLNETKVDPESELPSDRRYRNLVKDFSRKNKTQGTIERNFPLGAYSDKYYLVSQTEINELVEKGRLELEQSRAQAKELNPSVIDMGPAVGYWLPFFQKYPESSGLHILSRVGFSRQFAMVQVEGNHGWNGFSRTYILKRMKGKWMIINFSGNEWK